MKIRTLSILLALPFALYAKEDRIEETAIQRLEETSVLEIDKEALESLKEISDESEVSIHSHPGTIGKIESESEPELSATDTLDESQDEADAELAGVTDSTISDSMLQKLNLDMTTAIVPTFSRRIAAPYGIRTYRMHRGVDLGLCHGEDRTIVAAFAGVVKTVRNQGRRKGYGKHIIIDHGNGLTTLYAHLAEWKVAVGDTLQAGDTIGIGGNTGRSFGAHLHFEMRYNGIYIDPATVFNFEEGTYWNVTAVLDPKQLQETEDGFQKELSKHRYYKVRYGDCLGTIAKKYGISVTRLKQLNNIKGNLIRPGQMLRCS